MQKRQIGQTGLKTTILGFGTAGLGEHHALVSEEAAEQTLQAAYAAGINYFDTSPFYGYGLSEHRVGAFLRQHRRADYMISTKVGRVMVPRPAGTANPGPFKGGLPFNPVIDYSRAGILRSAEQSLLRLGLSSIDMTFLHDLDRWTHGSTFEARFAEAMQGAYPAMTELRKDGITKAIGIGVNDVDSRLRLIEAADFDCILLAGRYTLLEQEALDTVMAECQSRGIGVVIGGPYNSGILATGAVDGARYDYGPAPEHIVERVRAIEAVCARHAVPLAAAALQFPLGHPAVASVIPGAVSAAEISRNVALATHRIPAALWDELKQDRLLRREAPTPH